MTAHQKFCRALRERDAEHEGVFSVGVTSTGQAVPEAQAASGYESGSGFRDAFSRLIGDVPSEAMRHRALEAAWIDTRLGPMIAIADEDALYLLEYADRRGLEKEIEHLRKRLPVSIIPGRTRPIVQIEHELAAYFSGEVREFATPVAFFGTPFQKLVWKALSEVPYGETRSYADMARLVGRPSAVRAVASANAANRLAIVIPCHRVVNSSGALGGYGGGLARKAWLIGHEQARHPVRIPAMRAPAES
jgi:AraC family transcriptional regulator of adaptative response/methylated-DNA-[protein]-cysteine methyltransferase